jgi:hypothetical protein
MTGPTSGPDLKPRKFWTRADTLGIAGLIVDPATNGGTQNGVTAGQVADQLTEDLPAWGVWVNGLPIFVVGLIPFDGVRGVLHLAGTRMLSHRDHVFVVRGFLDSLPGVQVYTVTDNPALVRLARQVGMVQVGQQDGQFILERAS